MTHEGRTRALRSATVAPFLGSVLLAVAGAAFAAGIGERAETGVTVHRLWLFVHLLLFVFWLGADLGVFVCSRAIVKPGLTPAQRLRTAELMRSIDLAPRISASLMLTVGGILTEYVGVPHPWWQMAAILLLGPVWLALVLLGYVLEGRPLGELGVRLDQALRMLLVVAVPVSVSWSWYTGRLEQAPYVAGKLLIFAALMLLGLLLRRRLRPLTDGLDRLARGGTSDDVEAAMVASYARSRPLVAAIWIGLAAAALMGIAKPGAPATEVPAVALAGTLNAPLAPPPR